MAPQSILTNLVTVLGSAGLVTIAVAIISALVNWFRDHDAGEQYTKELNRLATRAAFWRTWLDGQLVALSAEASGEAKERVALELAKLSEKMTSLVVLNENWPRHSIFDLPPGVPRVPLWRRMLLLYPLASLPKKTRRWLRAGQVQWYMLIASLIPVCIMLLFPFASSGLRLPTHYSFYASAEVIGGVILIIWLWRIQTKRVLTALTESIVK